MATEYMSNEALLHKPDGWMDGTTNVIEFPKNPNLVRFAIARGHVLSSKTLDQYVDTQTKELAKRMPFFEVIHREERGIGGRRTLYLKCKSRDSSTELIHHRAAFQVGDQFLLLMLVGVAAADKEAEAVFEKALASIKLRSAAS